MNFYSVFEISPANSGIVLYEKGHETVVDATYVLDLPGTMRRFKGEISASPEDDVMHPMRLITAPVMFRDVDMERDDSR